MIKRKGSSSEVVRVEKVADDPTPAGRVKLPIKIHGGKYYLAPKLVAMFPRHLHYVEPCFGGGAPLLARDPMDERLWWPKTTGVSEVVNDLSMDLTNFWKVLQGGKSFAAFSRLCQATPFSEVEWDEASCELIEHPTPDENVSSAVVRAWRFFVVARQSLAGRMNGFTGVTKTRTRSGMNNETSAWVGSVEGLPAVHARLMRVLILNARPAVEVIRKHDQKATFFYLDPPYLTTTRSAPAVYQHEMSPEDHRHLLATLGGKKAASVLWVDDAIPEKYRKAKAIQGRFMLSGYHSPMYQAAAEACGWHVREFQVANNAAGGAAKRTMTEVVWMNYNPGKS